MHRPAGEPDPLAGLYGCPVERVPPGGLAVEVPPCPVCGHRQARPTYAIEGHAFRLVSCVECGLGRLHPQPDAETARSFYPPEYFGAAGSKFAGPVERLMRRLAAWQARLVRRGLPPGARVLDVGCGRGNLLCALADRGLEAHGVEAVEHAAEGADRRVKIVIAWRLAEAGYATAYFDAVVLWHVLEHLPDPRETLEEIRRVLRPGGKLVVAVPNFSSWQARWAGPAWFHLDLPRHRFHFPPSALGRLLVACGFRCESEHHFSVTQNPFGWVQSGLNRYGGLPRNGLYVLLHRRGTSGAAPYDCLTRFLLRLGGACGMPAAVALSALAAAARRGATVGVVARSERK